MIGCRGIVIRKQALIEALYSKKAKSLTKMTEELEELE